jgi:hypothetical protein
VAPRVEPWKLELLVPLAEEWGNQEISDQGIRTHQET